MSAQTEKSGQSVPLYHEINGAGLNIGVIAAQWHAIIMEGLIAGACRALAEAGVASTHMVRVPGSLELPVAAATLAPHYDALVALGVVIRGGTPHFDYVCSGVTAGLTQVSVSTCTPIGFGVLTCDNEDQALARCGLPDSNEDKGFEATQAAIVTCRALQI